MKGQNMKKFIILMAGLMACGCGLQADDCNSAENARYLKDIDELAISLNNSRYFTRGSEAREHRSCIAMQLNEISRSSEKFNNPELKSEVQELKNLVDAEPIGYEVKAGTLRKVRHLKDIAAIIVKKHKQ